LRGKRREFIKVMKAPSDPNRGKIIKMLQQWKLCVREMREALKVAQPTVSKYLKVLEDAGLVGFQREGLWVNCHLTDGASSPYVATLIGNLRHWLENDPEIDSLVKKLPSINREEVCRR
jgi:ArsR family transcriptional regulator